MATPLYQYLTLPPEATPLSFTLVPSLKLEVTRNACVLSPLVMYSFVPSRRNTVVSSAESWICQRTTCGRTFVRRFTISVTSNVCVPEVVDHDASSEPSAIISRSSERGFDEFDVVSPPCQTR